MTVLRKAGKTEDPLRLAYALAIRARAVEDALLVRGEERRDGEPSAQHMAEGDDEQDVSPLEKAFQTSPDALKMSTPCRDDSPCPFRIFAVLDPLSEEAQRLPAVLMLLHEELNAEVNLVLVFKALVSAPLVQYYRVAKATPAPPGGLAALGKWNGSMTGARFALPRRSGLLLSTLLHTP